MKKNRGVTLLEVLIAAALSGIVLSGLGIIFSSTLGSKRVSDQVTNATQSAEVVAALLDEDLAMAGYKGGAITTFLPTPTTPTSNPVPSAAQLALLNNIRQWPFTLSGSNLASVEVTNRSTTCNLNPASSNNSCDLLRVTSVTTLNSDTSAATTPYTLQRVTYSAYRDTTSNTFALYRATDTLTCNATTAASNPGVCTITTAGPQPAVEGVEEFQVFFNLTDGTASATVPSNLARIDSIGIYIRVRPDENLFSLGMADTTTYPTQDIRDALPNTLTNLSIPTQQYTGNDSRYRRVEKLLTLALESPQPCSLMPLAVNQSSVAGLSSGTAFTSDLGSGPGNFGWLSWDGSTSAPTLATNLTNPRAFASTYVNPTSSTDKQFTLGDPVQGSTGVMNSSAVTTALDNLAGQEVIVLLYSTFSGTGANLNYTVNGMARIRFTSITGGGSSRTLNATYLGPVTSSCL